jgi:putative oxidoreductase
MKKWLPIIAGIVLGLLFLMASVMFFLNLGPKPTFPEGSPISHFFAAFGPTGYLKFVKVFELIGGLLVMIPRLRNFGLLLLGPVIVNIVAYHMLVDDPMSILNIKFMWMLYIIVVCALYLFWDARKKFANLLG